jgi:hypothetical protein
VAQLPLLLPYDLANDQSIDKLLLLQHMEKCVFFDD